MIKVWDNLEIFKDNYIKSKILIIKSNKHRRIRYERIFIILVGNVKRTFLQNWIKHEIWDTDLNVL